MGKMFFSFSGRSGRGQWWLGLIVIAVIASILDGIFVGRAMSSISGIDPQDTAAIMAMVQSALLPASIIGLVLLWPGLAIYAKRWHDRNKSAWWSLIALIPVIGGIWLLVELGFLKGTAGPNQYGPDPLGG